MEEQIIGTHNSMTYLPLKNWWLKPLNWIAKCQSKDLIDQLNCGAKMVDMRVYLNEDGHWAFKHGLIKYNAFKEKHSMKYSQILSYDSGKNKYYPYDRYCKYDDDLYYYLDLLQEYAKEHGKIYVRIILESVNAKKEELEKSIFGLLCMNLERSYQNLIFVGGNYKKTWEVVYNFKNDYEPHFDQWVSSMQKCNLIERICPWLYAKKHNEENKERISKKFNTFDFI